MKRIIKIRTMMICATFLVIFGLGSAVIVAESFASAEMKTNRFVHYLLKNISIQAVISDDYWNKTYPYDYSAVERYQRKVTEVENAIESLCTISFPESERVNAGCNFLKNKVYHYAVDKITDQYSALLYVQDYTDNVIEFTRSLETEDYPFLYVRTPLPASLEYHAGTSNNTGFIFPRRAEALTAALVENGIDVIDFAKDTDHIYTFDSTSHWFPEDALYAASIIAKRLNEAYGYAYDPDAFRAENYQSLLKQYPDVARTISEIHGYAFDIPVPTAQTQFTVIYAESEEWSGCFTESFIRPNDQWSTESGPYHNMLRIVNSLIHEIHNNGVTTNKDKHILVIGDSFDWPLVSYLAMGTGKVTLLHNSSFTGSILSYIRETDPDMVIMAYNDIEYDALYTETAFYLE